MQVVLQFYPWLKFYFLLFLGIVMYDNEFESKENKIWTKVKIEPQHIQRVIDLTSDINFFQGMPMPFKNHHLSCSSSIAHSSVNIT